MAKKPLSATEKIRNHILKNPAAANAEVAARFNSTAQFVSNCRTKLRKAGQVPKAAADYRRKTVIEKVSDPVAYTKERIDAKQQQDQKASLVKKIISLENDVAFLTDFKKHKPKTFNIYAPSNSKKHEATAVTQWSDWHVDEVVKPSRVNGFNEYNPEIAEKRAKTLFENTIKLVNTQRTGVIIKRLIVHLGGDPITGWIHEENMQTNSMTPQEGIFFANDLHIAGFEYLLKYGDFDEIYVVCSRGNHGRVTKKMHYKNDSNTNNENYMYKMLAARFRGNSKIHFQIDDAELAYMSVYNNTLRFFHGWQIKFKGGIGGLTIPLFKALHRWDSNIQGFYNFMADKHNYSLPTPHCVLNGSLIGFSELALSWGFKFEPAQQSFTLLDSKRGVTIKAPIFCE